MAKLTFKQAIKRLEKVENELLNQVVKEIIEPIARETAHKLVESTPVRTGRSVANYTVNSTGRKTPERRPVGKPEKIKDKAHKKIDTFFDKQKMRKVGKAPKIQIYNPVGYNAIRANKDGSKSEILKDLNKNINRALKEDAPKIIKKAWSESQ